MKVEWQIEDVRAGRRVGKPGRKEQWMICYSPSEGATRWGLVSLSDGALAFVNRSREYAVNHLNTAGELPLELFNYE